MFHDGMYIGGDLIRAAPASKSTASPYSLYGFPLPGVPIIRVPYDTDIISYLWRIIA
jgi:hypothetical protein